MVNECTWVNHNFVLQNSIWFGLYYTWHYIASYLICIYLNNYDKTMLWLNPANAAWCLQNKKLSSHILWHFVYIGQLVTKILKWCWPPTMWFKTWSGCFTWIKLLHRIWPTLYECMAKMFAKFSNAARNRSKVCHGINIQQDRMTCKCNDAKEGNPIFKCRLIMARWHVYQAFAFPY